MSCSSKRKIAAGSCISTLGSSTNARRAPFAGRLFMIPGSQRACCRQDLPGVARYPDLAPFALQNSVGVDQEGAALDAHRLAAIHVLLFPDAEQAGDRMPLVGAQLERGACDRRPVR